MWTPHCMSSSVMPDSINMRYKFFVGFDYIYFFATIAHVHCSAALSLLTFSQSINRCLIVEAEIIKTTEMPTTDNTRIAEKDILEVMP